MGTLSPLLPKPLKFIDNGLRIPIGCGKVQWFTRSWGADLAMALVQYRYRAKPDDAPVVSWLTYVFQLEDGRWRIVHDQNTALDFGAFARMAGIEIP